MQTDTWWQLRAGRDMWASARVLLTDTYSHTAAGAFWVNHEWLAELIFYGLYRVGGLGLLTIFCAGLIAAGWMVSWAMRRGPLRPAFVMFLSALVACSGWWEPRPHAFSLLFIPLLVSLMCQRQDVWLPVLFLVWAQCHGGVFLGLALLSVGLAARVLMDRAAWRRSLFVLLASVLAMTATPLGVHFWTEIPKSLSRINQYTLNEWMRPELSELQLLPFWIISALYVVALGRRPRHLTQISAADATLHACALLLLAGALGAVRNVGPFLMLACPALTRLWRLEPTPSRAASQTDRPSINVLIQAAAIAAVAFVLVTAYRQKWARLKWNPMPEEASAALRECPGNLYNRYDEGGMLLWFVPERRVFLDGRQDPFPASLVLEHIEMETGKRDYHETFERHDIRCAFLPTVSPTAARLTRSEWIPVYQNRQWVVLKKP